MKYVTDLYTQTTGVVFVYKNAKVRRHLLQRWSNPLTVGRTVEKETVSSFLALDNVFPTCQIHIYLLSFSFVAPCSNSPVTISLTTRLSVTINRFHLR